MRLLISAVAAVTVLAATAVSSPLAMADTHPRVQPLDCASIATKIGRAKGWQAVFWAQRLDDFGQREEILAAPCFATETNCKAWLYWAQTDWPNQLVVHFCKVGMPY